MDTYFSNRFILVKSDNPENIYNLFIKITLFKMSKAFLNQSI